MEKGSITISIGHNVTEDEIREIRNVFKQSNIYDNYTLNIIICGNEDFKQNLKNFLKAGVMP